MNVSIYIVFCLMLLSSCNSSDTIRQEITYLRSVQDSLRREIRELRLEQTYLKARFLSEQKSPYKQPDTKPIWIDCYVPMEKSPDLLTPQHLK